MGKLIPIMFLLVGLAVGGVAGLLLHDPGEEAEALFSEQIAPRALEYVKLPNQFVIPILDRGRVGSIVVMSLSIEVPVGQTQSVLLKEPKLRDEILRVLFDHANAGGFRGTFTESGNLSVIRRALLETGQKIVGAHVSNVLITDIARQDS